MSTGPPFTPDDSGTKTEWSDWREQTKRLDFPGRDIRIIFPAQHQGTVHNPEYQPPDFGDFDPKPDDPDPEVWPVEGLDPGYPAEIDELIFIQNSFPAPHVAWVTEEFLEARYGYNPVRQEVEDIELPKWARPDRTPEDGLVEIDARNDHPVSLELTPDRIEAGRRVARLWNGEKVRGKHLLLDKCPSWNALFGDLDQEELKRLVVDPEADPALADAFGEYSWYEQSQAVYLRPERILRKKVWYAPTQLGRTLINEHDDFPELRGDLNEGLTHRFTVGLTAVREFGRGRKVSTYHDVEDYIIDILSQDSDGQLYAGEIVTGHHNWKLHRRTYRKLSDLRSRGIEPYVVFDSRSTAYRIFNHWHKADLADLPHGQFNSDFRISEGRKQIQDAFADETCRWDIADWMTTSLLWRKTLGSNSLGVFPDNIVSLSW